MVRIVEYVGGGVLGFLAGSFLCVPLLAHVFSPAVVTWNAAACPPGIYTITSTATTLDGSRSFTTTTEHVRFPSPALTQQFSDLPFGQYLVTAIVRDRTGRTFEATQSLDTAGPASRFRGRQVAAAISAPSARGGSAASTLAAAPSRMAMTESRAEALTDPRSVESSEPLVMSRAMIEVLLGTSGRNRGNARGLLDSDRRWQRITFVDSDADGIQDQVTIEWSDGSVWVMSIGNLYVDGGL
jgi:hypothetical protein